MTRYDTERYKSGESNEQGQNAVEDDPDDVLNRIEEDLNSAISDLYHAEQTIEQVGNRLAILRERDEMPGESQ